MLCFPNERRAYVTVLFYSALTRDTKWWVSGFKSQREEGAQFFGVFFFLLQNFNYKSQPIFQFLQKYFSSTHPLPKYIWYRSTWLVRNCLYYCPWIIDFNYAKSYILVEFFSFISLLTWIKSIIEHNFIIFFLLKDWVSETRSDIEVIFWTAPRFLKFLEQRKFAKCTY